MPKTTSLDLRELTEPFNAWCAKRRVSRSLAIRQLVMAALGVEPQLSCLPPAEAAPPVNDWDGVAPNEEEPAHRFTLRLTRTQHDSLRARAAEAGISCSRYLVAALTARASDPCAIAGKDAVRALVRSNDLLAQTVLKLSAWCLRAASSDADLVKELQALLREHLARAATIVSQVERTRIGTTHQRAKTGRKVVDARPGRSRGGARALG